MRFERIGRYHVTALIGEGGMGQVWQATGTQLHRQVALKILPDAFANDPDRLARFQREAQVLASLNHPNIAQIHGIEEAEGTRALVLELVEGPTLANRIAEGPIPLDEALPIAKQIAEALEAAHEAGVIHRDLKPANIKVREDGTVKVLDFGLAKALDPAPAGDPSQSPTVTAAGTQQGVILGTAAYMSPEQASGKPVDKRADIWAFGCVIHEMVTGAPTFDGAGVLEIASKVLHQPPDLGTIPDDVPPVLRSFLTRCLEKDPRRRVRDIGDVRLALEGAFVPLGGVPAGIGRRRVALAAAAGLAVGLAGTVFIVVSTPPRAEPVVTRIAVTLSPAVQLSVQDDRNVAITADGSRVVYAGNAATGRQRQLFVRSLDALAATTLLGLGDFPRSPFVSPGGAAVGYFTGVTGLWRVPIDGGPPTLICLTGDEPGGASWAVDGTIVFATRDPDTGLWRVPASGGEPELLTTPAGDDGDHLWPEILPTGRAVLFTISAQPIENAQLAVLRLQTGDYEILGRGYDARYSPTGHLVFGRDGALWAVGFDSRALELIGDPVRVLEQVDTEASGAVNFALSSHGSLVYFGGGTPILDTFEWVDRDGRTTPGLTDASSPRLSPDGTQLSFRRSSNFWVFNLDSSSEVRLTSSAGWAQSWMPDGRNLSFSASSADGSAVYVTTNQIGELDTLLAIPGHNLGGGVDWAPDSERFLFQRESRAAPGNDDIWWAAVDGTPEPFIVTASDERNPRFSPNGRWVAYVSDQTGQDRVFLQPFPEGGSPVPVSPGPGVEPVWSSDGRELHYRNDVSVVAVAIDPDSGAVGSAQDLFDDVYERIVGSGWSFYDVAADGQFLMHRRSGGPQLHLVLNWHQELKRLVPVD